MPFRSLTHFLASAINTPEPNFFKSRRQKGGTNGSGGGGGCLCSCCVVCCSPHPRKSPPCLCPKFKKCPPKRVKISDFHEPRCRTPTITALFRFRRFENINPWRSSGPSTDKTPLARSGSTFPKHIGAGAQSPFDGQRETV